MQYKLSLQLSKFPSCETKSITHARNSNAVIYGLAYKRSNGYIGIIKFPGISYLFVKIFPEIQLIAFRDKSKTNIYKLHIYITRLKLFYILQLLQFFVTKYRNEEKESKS